MYCHPEHVVFKDWGSKIVILDVRTSEYFTLGETGAELFRLLIAGKDVDEAIESMLESYDVPRSTVQADVQALLARLCEKGLLVEKA